MELRDFFVVLIFTIALVVEAKEPAVVKAPETALESYRLQPKCKNPQDSLEVLVATGRILEAQDDRVKLLTAPEGAGPWRDPTKFQLSNKSAVKVLPSADKFKLTFTNKF